MGGMSPGAWVHCGRVFSAEDIADLCQTVAWLPRLGRRELAATLCEHWQWYTVTGTAKVHAGREFLERLEAAGLVVLPPLQVARRRRPFMAPWPRSARCTWRRYAPTPRGGGAVECGRRTLASAGLQGRLRLPAALLHHRGRAALGLCAVGRCRARPGGA